jgi:hypothetical protein
VGGQVRATWGLAQFFTALVLSSDPLEIHFWVDGITGLSYCAWPLLVNFFAHFLARIHHSGHEVYFISVLIFVALMTGDVE